MFQNMKFLALFLLIPAFAYAGGDLVSSMTYVDDAQNFKYSPYVGIKMDGSLWKLSTLVEAGGGFLDQGSAVDGSYSRLGGDIFYKTDSGWKLGAGMALESNPSVMKQFEDYAHVTASLKLW